jgi:hypothetical protein
LEIKKFLDSVDEFSALHIDQDPDPEGDLHPNIFSNKIVNHHIVQFPNNHIPKGLVPLERLFDGNDVAVKEKVSNKEVDVTKCNIDIEEEPKFIKLSNNLSKE